MLRYSIGKPGTGKTTRALDIAATIAEDRRGMAVAVGKRVPPVDFWGWDWPPVDWNDWLEEGWDRARLVGEEYESMVSHLWSLTESSEHEVSAVVLDEAHRVLYKHTAFVQQLLKEHRHSRCEWLLVLHNLGEVPRDLRAEADIIYLHRYPDARNIPAFDGRIIRQWGECERFGFPEWASSLELPEIVADARMCHDAVAIDVEHQTATWQSTNHED